MSYTRQYIDRENISLSNFPIDKGIKIAHLNIRSLKNIKDSRPRTVS